MFFVLILAHASSLEDDALYGEYQFYKNFGPVFYDYSGRNYHAINGEFIGDESYATIPTDRGAYFTGSSYIQLHNTVWPGPHFDTKWRIMIWFFRSSGNGLFTRKNSVTGDEVISYYFTGTNMVCEVTTESENETITSTNTFGTGDN